MRSVLLLLGLAVWVPSLAIAQTANPPRPIIGLARSELTFNREVLSDNESRIATINWVNTDCSAGALPELRFVTQPKAGTVRTQEMTIPIDRPANNSRASCNGKPVQALAIFYKPNAGYAGTDDVVVDVDFHMGNVRRINYKITVR